MQLLTANANSPHRQAAPVGVGQTEPPSAELPTEQLILRQKVGKGVTLAALQPTSEHDEEQLEGRNVDHERQLTSRSVATKASIESWDTTPVLPPAQRRGQ